MSFRGLVRRISTVRVLLLGLVLLAGCDGTGNDLNPSGADERPEVEQGIIGSGVGQKIADFTITATDGNQYTRDDLLAAGQPLVLYFTMWCPICDAHQSHYLRQIGPDFPGVNYLLVDFVSGSVAGSRDTQISSGYRSQTVLVDLANTLEVALEGSMGATVVVDLNGIIRMNEDYKDGSRLRNVLNDLVN